MPDHRIAQQKNRIRNHFKSAFFNVVFEHRPSRLILETDNAFLI